MDFNIFAAFLSGVVVTLVAVVTGLILFINWLPIFFVPKRNSIPQKPVSKNEWDPHLNKSGWLQVSLELLSQHDVGQPEINAVEGIKLIN